jgi:hypothetical protein
MLVLATGGPTMTERQHIDLSKVSDADLANVSNEVLRNLAKRIQSKVIEDEGPTEFFVGPHDKHTSVHAKNSKVLET